MSLHVAVTVKLSEYFDSSSLVVAV